MSDQTLFALLKGLSYDAEKIRRIMAADEAHEVEKIQAARDATAQLLTPQAAAALSKRHAAEVEQLGSALYHATKCRFSLPRDGTHIDVLAMDRAFSEAGTGSETRMALKHRIYAMGMIPR